MYRITLRVTGVDLEVDEVLERLERCHDDLAWSVIDGQTTATLYAECEDPVGAAVQAARSIVAACPQATVAEMDPDLVNVSDIAKRIGVNRETVRLWSEGKRGPGGFPAPFGTTGDGDRGSSRIWLWADVNPWLRHHYDLGDEEFYLNAEQRADVNARLRRIKQEIDKEWEAVQVTTPAVRVNPATFHGGSGSDTFLVFAYDPEHLFGATVELQPPELGRIRHIWETRRYIASVDVQTEDVR